MSMTKQKTVSPELTALCARVQQWRKQAGGRGSHVPDDLWHEAARVARIDGLYATAQHTRFNYQRLKTHCAQMGPNKEPVPLIDQNRSAHKQAPLDTRFIALQVAAPSIKSRTSIELWARHGDRMRVEVDSDLDVVGLLQTLWSRPS
jgi:hypothetical protein